MAKYADDEDEDLDLEKDCLNVEVGVEFAGVHNVTFCTDVAICLSDPGGSARRLQEIVNLLKKGIPASEYTEGDMVLDRKGQIDFADDEGEGEDEDERNEKLRDLQNKFKPKEDKK